MKTNFFLEHVGELCIIILRRNNETEMTLTEPDLLNIERYEEVQVQIDNSARKIKKLHTVVSKPYTCSIKEVHYSYIPD
jgi:hypothetical protein